ncbi:MAG: response regulator [Deltaproteobacteria bacterium]|nr:response regulator [Deltaproteobacteria bacterium]
MSYYTLIPLCAFLINFFVGIYVYAKRRKSAVNRAFVLFSMCLSVWTLLDLISWSAIPDEWQEILLVVRPLVWLPAGFLTLNFGYALVDRKRDAFYYACGATTLIVVIASATTDWLHQGFEQTYWGIREIPGPLFVLFTIVATAVPTVSMLTLVYLKLRKTTNPDDQRPLQLVLIGGFAVVVLGFVSDVILPAGLQLTEVPDFGPSITSIFSCFIFMAVVQYNFLSPGVEEATEYIFEKAQDGVFLLDKNKRLLKANRAAREILRLDEGLSTATQVLEWLEHWDKAGEQSVYEMAIDIDGEQRILVVSQSAIEKGKVHLGKFIILRDITKRKQAEEAVRRSEERYRLLFDSGNDAIFVFELNPDGSSGRFIEVNDVACQILERSKEELLTMRPDDISAYAGTRLYQATFKSILKRRRVLFETEIVTKEGRTIPTEIVAHLFDLDGRQTIYSTARDISKRRSSDEEKCELEEQLRQSQKMEAVGTLAGGIAHDMNNVLGGIMGFASVLKMEIPLDDPRSRDIDEILTSAKRGRDLTRDLLGFARKGRFVKKRISLNRTVRETVNLLERTISKKIIIDVHLADRLDDIEGDPSQVSHALLNLCLNAAEAMDGVNTLTLTTENRQLTRTESSRHPNLEPGRYVAVTVIDTGKGMDNETRQRVFEPFFTTKAPGEGTGLGLAMVYGTVTNHGGTVTVDSQIGRGTTVALLLPSAKGAPIAPSRTSISLSDHELRCRGMKVLLVDDEALIRTAGQRMLEKLGVGVFLAENGIAGIETYRKHQSEIDLVILDMAMPEMDGAECFRRLIEFDPEVSILVSSGFAKGKDTEELLESGAVGFLPKPFEMKHLTSALNRAMGPTS